MLANPNVPPLPPMPSKKAHFNLQDAHNHVPAATIKLLRAQLTPLAEDSLPEPADLGAFWEKVRHAL